MNTLRLDGVTHWINGRSTEPVEDSWLQVTSPSTGRPVRRVAAGGQQDLDAAVSSAQTAQLSWKRMQSLERGKHLHELGRAIRQDREHLAQLEVSETGKPLLVALAEIDSTAGFFEFYGGIAGLPVGETLDVAADQHVYTRREPFGVIGVITPWNMPANQAGRSCAPALAAGNCVVVKPSESTSSTTVRLAELASQVGFPDGVFNVVLGAGDTVGAALVSNPGIDKVAFTGSVATGRAIGALAADRVLPLTLELGGKSANIILDDADLDQAVEAAALAFTSNAGQVCSAGSRLLVQRSVHDVFVSKLVERIRKIRLGVDIGPIITRPQFERVQGYFNVAREEGAELMIGGKVAEDRSLAGGFYIEPTVYASVGNNMRIAQEEIFGPVGVVIPFETDAEAISLANGSDYGLVAALWTRDMSRAFRATDGLRSGQVYVNSWTTGSVQTPFGGWKLSGYGREKGVEALRQYTEVKCVTIKLEMEDQAKP